MDELGKDKQTLIDEKWHLRTSNQQRKDEICWWQAECGKFKAEIDRLEGLIKAGKDTALKALANTYEAYRIKIAGLEEENGQLKQKLTDATKGWCIVEGPLFGNDNKPPKCPVCEGKGKVVKAVKLNVISGDFWVPDREINTLSKVKKDCHGCEGKGWVKV